MIFLKNLIQKYQNIFIVGCILIVFIISYQKVPFLFFQQDEILGFGQFIQKGWSVILQGIGSNKITHFVPLTMSFSYLIYHFFGPKYFIYNSFGLFFHLINGFLVYKICLSYCKDKISSTIAAIIFLSSGVAAELVMWPVINLNTLSLTFALWAWFLTYNSKKIWLISVLFLLSVFSVEYSIGISLFILVLIYFNNKGLTKQKISYSIPFIGTILTYALFRFFPIIFSNSSNIIVNARQTSFFSINILTLIPKYISQLFLGQNIILFVSVKLQKFLNLDNLGTAFSETNIYPILSTFFGLVLIFIFWVWIYKADKINKVYKKNLIFGFLFIVFSALPFILIPNGIDVSTISSRYMYFGLAGMAFLSSVIYNILKNNYSQKLYLIFLGIVFILVTTGSIQNSKHANNLYKIGIQRKNILNQILTTYPNLQSKTVFYMESNKSYYGLPEETKIFPFQSGLGQTLLVFYSQSNKLPNGFYPGKYLWEISSEGYYEEAGRGFGFYRNLDLLKTDMKKYNLTENSVIAFRWNGETEKLTDITTETREVTSKNE